MKKFYLTFCVGVSLIIYFLVIGICIQARNIDILKQSVLRYQKIKASLDNKSIASILSSTEPTSITSPTPTTSSTVTNDDLRKERVNLSWIQQSTTFPDTSEASSNVSSTSPLMIDLSNLSFVIFNNVCRDVTRLPILAVMLVTSHAGNALKRDAIREAYPTSELTTLGICRVFLLATLANNTEPNRAYKSISPCRLRRENQLYADILQLNMIEAYTNLTYKHLMGLKYAATHCTSAKFVLKADDDALYDIYQLTEVLKSVKREDRNNLVGNGMAGDVIRVKSKYYVPRTQFAPDVYPKYLSGYLYFTSVVTAGVLVETSKLVPFISVDDALVTGIVAEKAGVKRSQLGRLSGGTLKCCRDVDMRIVYQCEFVAALTGKPDKEMLLKIRLHSSYCFYSKNCKDKSGVKFVSNNLTCF